MADGQSMTVADVVAKTMDGRLLEDFVREAVVLVARELMAGEMSAEVGAGLGEVAPETRLTHRNGIARGRGRRGFGEIHCWSRRSVGARVLSVVLGAASVLGASDRVGRARGVRERRLDSQGSAAGGAAGDRRDGEGSRQRECPAWMSGRGVSAATA